MKIRVSKNKRYGDGVPVAQSGYDEEVQELMRERQLERRLNARDYAAEQRGIKQANKELKQLKKIKGKLQPEDVRNILERNNTYDYLTSEKLNDFDDIVKKEVGEEVKKLPRSVGRNIGRTGRVLGRIAGPALTAYELYDATSEGINQSLETTGYYPPSLGSTGLPGQPRIGVGLDSPIAASNENINTQSLNQFYDNAFQTIDKSPGTAVDPFQQSNSEYARIADERIKNNPSSTGQQTPPSTSRRPTIQNEYTAPDGTYEVRKGDWLSSIAPQFNTTVDEILKANPQITNRDQIKPGDKINIPGQTPNARTNAQANGSLVEQPLPVAEWDDLRRLEQSEQQRTQGEEQALKDAQGKELTLDYMNSITDTVSNVVSNVGQKKLLGRIDSSVPTNQLETGMNILSRGITPEYLSDATVPRTFDYYDIDPTPYLDEIDSGVSRALQNVNPNTTQGQAINAAISANSIDQKRKVLNQVNQQNIQNRIRIDNQNNQLLTGAEIRDDANRRDYFTRTQQSQAAYDRERMNLAGRFDALQSQRTNLRNFFTLENMRNPNYQIDPFGHIYREKTEDWQNKPTPPPVKSRFGFSKRISGKINCK